MLLRDLHRWTVRARSAFICHKAVCVPGSQPRPGSIVARSTAHRPETRRNRAHFAPRTRRNFLSFPVPCSTARGKESARQNAGRAGLTNPSGRLVMRARAASVLSVAFLVLSFLVSLGAGAAPTFGPKQYLRTAGAPQT